MQLGATLLQLGTTLLQLGATLLQLGATLLQLGATLLQLVETGLQIGGILLQLCDVLQGKASLALFWLLHSVRRYGWQFCGGRPVRQSWDDVWIGWKQKRNCYFNYVFQNSDYKSSYGSI